MKSACPEYDAQNQENGCNYLLEAEEKDIRGADDL